MMQSILTPDSLAMNDTLRLYQDIVETSQDLFWQLDLGYRFTYLNPAWETIFGYSIDKMLGRKITDLESLGFTEKQLHAFRELPDDGTMKAFELVLIDKNKNDVFLLFNSRALINDHGIRTGARGVAYNITSQKITEMKLREREAQLKKAQQIAHVGNWEFDCVTKKLICSEEVYTILETSPSVKTVPVDLFVPYLHQDDRSAVEHADEEYPVSKAPYDFVNRRSFPDGRVKYLLVRGETIFNDAGKPVRLTGILQDISKQKMAEETIAAEKEQLAITMRCIGDGVITTDTDGLIVIMNKVAEELTGWKQNEAAGRILSSVFKPVDEMSGKPCADPISKVLTICDNIELVNQALLVSRDGTVRTIEDSGAPIKNAAGEIIGVVIVFRDITEKKKLLESTQRADKLDAVGVLAGGIAHDFNNLLGGIFGYVDLANETTDDPVISKYLTAVMSTIERARSLTQQLLTFAKGGAPLKKSGDIRMLLKDTVQFALSGSNVSCRYDIQDDLWMCNFDKNQIIQVIENLVINALQAMPVGGIIDVKANNVALVVDKDELSLAAGKYVRISVADSGVGIPKDLLKRIFDPFFSTKENGHGLGLSTCYSIVKRHGGSIDVESEPGKGSVFNVYLPCVENTGRSETSSQCMRHRGHGAFVVMDDEPIIRETIGEMLRLSGYAVIYKENGQSAIDYLRSELDANRSVSGMILDLTIPGAKGGLESIPEIRKLSADLPVFVTSGYADDPAIADPSAYGFTASICKPMRNAELTAMLNKYMP